MNCRPGDDAVVTAPPQHPWFGQIVRVLGAADPGHGFFWDSDDPIWLVGWAGADMATARDSQLRPLRGFYSPRPKRLILSPAMGAPVIEIFLTNPALVRLSRPNG